MYFNQNITKATKMLDTIMRCVSTCLIKAEAQAIRLVRLVEYAVFYL
jgi:hypothetical protein